MSLELCRSRCFFLPDGKNAHRTPDEMLTLLQSERVLAMLVTTYSEARALKHLLRDPFCGVRHHNRPLVVADNTMVGAIRAASRRDREQADSVTILARRRIKHYQVEVHVDQNGPHLHLDRQTKREIYISLRTFRRLPNALEEEEDIWDAIRRAALYRLE